jgi:hypothetical protein
MAKEENAAGASRFRSVKVLADLTLLETAAGGLSQPLDLPTPSLVFRFVDGDLAGAGTVGVIEAEGRPRLEPGSVFRASVQFPDAPPNEEFAARRFELWQGHVVGEARVVEVQTDERPNLA